MVGRKGGGAKRARNHSGTVYRRTDGLWVGRVVFEGKRHQVTAAKEADCARRLRGVIRELEEGRNPANVPRRRTVAQVGREFLAHTALTRPATLASRRSYLENHLLGRDAADPKDRIRPHPLAAKRVADVTPSDLRALYAAKAADLAPSTVRQLHRIVKTMFGWAAGEGVPVQPGVLRLASPDVPAVERVQLTPAQVARLFRSAAERGDDLEAVWRLIWYTGCRLGEVLALPWENVDLGRREVLIRRILRRVEPGTGRPIWGSGKTFEGRRPLPVGDDAVAALRRHFARQQERRAELGAAWREHGLVFDRGDGGAFRHEAVEARFYAALATAKLPRCRVHDLRGASGTALREAGHDLVDIQRRLGHANIATTVGSYLRPTVDADRRTADTLERVVREG